MKDIFLNFYNYKALGMKSMLSALQITWDDCFHHSGIDDVTNIAEILKLMIKEGAEFRITATKNPSTGFISYSFFNRIGKRYVRFHFNSKK